ncbi:MAG: ABC-type transport auxiliary lipoprotein family protein [Steroidobacteraceae bacterium]
MNRSIAWIGVLPLIGLAACTGSLFQSKIPPPTLYLLSASAALPDPAAAPAAIPADLAILRPRMRTGLETDRIAVLYPDRRLDYFADARWTGPLNEVLQDLTVQEFRARANLRSVGAEASLFATDYWLEVEVTDFQAEYTGAAAAPTVRVQILARLGDSADRHILGQFKATVQQPAADNRLTAIVDAYARAADAALAQIVAHTDDALAKTSEVR